MWAGKIESIHIADDAKAPMQSVDQVEAIAGVGLEGDRYATRLGTFFKPEPDFERTLIEAEAVKVWPASTDWNSKRRTRAATW